MKIVCTVQAGKNVDKRDCPSTKPASQGTEADNRRKSILVSSKVRGITTCHEYFKPRCIYLKAKLPVDEQIALKRVQESQLCTCGSSIFPPTSACKESFSWWGKWGKRKPLFPHPKHRKKQSGHETSFTCGDPIELSYYSAALVHFPLICYWCGIPEDSLDEYMKLERNFKLCML